MDELDEIDKQSIALYGVMQEKKSATNRIGAHNHAKNVVTLDRKWLSWNRDSHIITKAFKMAWLQYEASNVKWDNKLYNRLEFIKLRSMLFDKISKVESIRSFKNDDYTVSDDESSDQNALRKIFSNASNVMTRNSNFR